ncbi:hypothetical protein ACFVXC_19905 [Streptomyces sp. NPDC058257]|uniref:hypothetical protein n=1 Tax=Streptomyces sp. NPDC058257 TaxID=3346409 RepID=UPI0036E29D8D
MSDARCVMSWPGGRVAGWPGGRVAGSAERRGGGGDGLMPTAAPCRHRGRPAAAAFQTAAPTAVTDLFGTVVPTVDAIPA